MSRVFCFIFVCFFGSCLYSQPVGPEVISGSAEITKQGQQLLIQTQSDKTVIHWDEFSIEAKELTHFLQPHVRAATLNRVLSATPSEILGSLTSNGVIFLINPNGILVGAEGRIDVNGLVASTLDFDTAAFLRGEDLLFSGDSAAAIENLGLIQGGDEGVFLIGRHLVNQGDILAASSEVHFGAGHHILLKTKERHIYIHPDLEEHSQGIGVDQRGRIEAGKVEIQAEGNLYELAVRHRGEIQALATVEREGEIYLVAHGGEAVVDEKGTLFAGKTIEVLGERVTLLDEATIQTQEAGKIVIGGEPGREQSATHTAIATNVLVNSNLSERGNGGTVTLFGTEATAFYGNVFAQGGTAGGDGGIVEVSGGNLFYSGMVYTEAPKGSDGLLILDPTNITISGGATAGGTFSGTSPTNVFSLAFTAGAATLNSGALNTALQSNDVLVTTASAFGSAGNITISGTTNLNAATTSHNLTLLADNNITVSSPLTFIDSAGGTSTLTMTAAGDITLNSSITGSNLAAIHLTTTGTGTIDLDNAINASGIPVTITSGGDITSTGGGTNLLTASQCIMTATGDITMTNDIIFTGNGSGSALTMTAGVDFNHDNTMTFNNWGAVMASTTTGDFHVDAGTVCTGTGSVTYHGGVDLFNEGGTNLFNDTTGQNTNLTLSAGRDITINSQIDLNNFNSATLTAARDVIFNNDFEPDQTTTVSVSAGRDITHTGAAADIIANNGTILSFTAANDFTSDEPITISNFSTVNITATSGDVNLTVAAVNIPGANTTITAGNDINILTAVRNVASGDMTLNAGNDVNIGPVAIVSQIGTADGVLSVTTGRDLNVIGGTGSSDRSQLGFNAVLVDSDIDLTIGRNINVTAGTNSSSVALIGHGFATAGMYSGDIIIRSVGGDVTITGDTGAAGSVKFAQIGHSRFTGGTSSFTGDIRGATAGSPAAISGALTLTGGSDTTCFALFGHGGRDSNALETYSGNIRVQANDIVLTGGTSTDCNASIGFFIVSQGGGANPVIVTPTSSVEVISDTTLTMTASTNGIVSIGG
ncbi:MAG: filamentous hemagglutinin N-terminal domain-containing protein, partial [Bdellovibrionales bacterium]|nr:filamentous hemagglutinin N-terminal domain-containing protein [Bdellovibrionales bacterium]